MRPMPVVRIYARELISDKHVLKRGIWREINWSDPKKGEEEYIRRKEVIELIKIMKKHHDETIKAITENKSRNKCVMTSSKICEMLRLLGIEDAWNWER